MPAPTNAAKSGKLVLFSAETATGVFTEVLSARENSFSMQAADIDTSCKADGNFGSSLPGDITVTSTLSGPFRDTTEDNWLRAQFLTQEPFQGKYVTSNGDVFQGYWVIMKYDVTGSKAGAEEFSIDLKNFGEITHTPAP